ncbi:nucleobindin 1 isoform X2 [Colletes latitarsis]|uniref:nucleobindin 1 isoform X2 n=1 Tax=Colletes latitarsis TaxID=2605962 RepID=UPI0040371D53
MKYFLLFILIIATVQLSVAPPVNQKNKDGEHDGENEVDDVDEMADIMEYRRYLMEVVQVLESDPDFRATLEKADEADIRTGKIADQLQFLNHNVRSRLDEIKREELERLRHLATKENELKDGLDIDHLKITEHLDHTNTRTFEIQDLKKLIAKTTKDLAKTDRKRREEFKQHEMERKFEEQEKLKKMDEQEKQKYEEELQAMKEKHKTHEPVHHPGSKQQLEEVWEKQDHMDTEDFNPKTFFFLHDVDGNGVWDQDEVKALFLKELDKLYAQGATNDDLLKRAEEMERMREHVFNEADLNKDGLISFEEFVEQTKKPDFQQDQGWQPLDEQQIYTQEEFEAFEKYKHEEIERLIAQGMLQPDQGNIPAQHESFPPQYARHPVPPQEYAQPRGPNQNLPHQQQFQDPNHLQYQHQPQAVHQQQYPNHVPVHGQMPQQYPDLSQHQQFQGELPPNQQHHQMQVPQLHVPVQQHQGQVPIQQHEQMQVAQPHVPVQQHQGQVPIQQHEQMQVAQPHVPVQQHQGQVPIQQHEQMQVVQPHVPVQQHQGQVPVQQHEGQVPVQQYGQIPVQEQHGQIPVQQNTVNQVPHSVESNAVPQVNSPNQLNSQPSPVLAHHEINRNNIETGGKV